MTHIFTCLLVLVFSLSSPALERNAGFWQSSIAAKTPPVWPKTAQEMNAFLKVDGTSIPDTLTAPGRNKTVWELGPNKITLELHPYHPNAPTWHKDPHWHLDTPGNPHQRYLPGDPIPGY